MKAGDSGRPTRRGQANRPGRLRCSDCTSQIPERLRRSGSQSEPGVSPDVYGLSNNVHYG